MTDVEVGWNTPKEDFQPPHTHGYSDPNTVHNAQHTA